MLFVFIFGKFWTVPKYLVFEYWDPLFEYSRVQEGARWFLQGEDRLTCLAQPDHGGMRSDSPRGGITTAGTELMWLIDPKPSNQKETQYSYPHKIGDIGVSPWASNKISLGPL